MSDLKPNEFLVWDELNCHIEDAEDEGTVIVDEDAEMAAMQYAEDDADGWTDGLYHGSAQPIMVRNAKGQMFRLQVYAEMVPQFSVVKREEL